MTKQLIIIGNGFDLACGLKSSYKDFFEWHIGNLEKRNELLNKTFRQNKTFKYDYNKEPNLLMLALMKDFKDKDKYWVDIEDKLKSIVFSNFEDTETTQNNKKASLNWVFEFLKDLESNFNHYLNLAVIGSQEYKDNANKNMNILLSKDLDENIENSSLDSQIFSFNYTNEFDNLFFDNCRIQNIHGTLKNGDIIFGIDGFDLSNKEYQLINKFSKTYRLMRLKIENLNISPDTDLIKFYGHSLGEADYSYFQTIFDIVNLYSGTTKLIFYFSVYGGKTLEEVEEEITERVWALIQKYGATLDNKDHGKNLIHKLRMENRLVIEELKF